MRDDVGDCDVLLIRCAEFRPIPGNWVREPETTAVNQNRHTGRDHTLGPRKNKLQDVARPPTRGSSIRETAPKVDHERTLVIRGECGTALSVIREAPLERLGNRLEARRNVSVRR